MAGPATTNGIATKALGVRMQIKKWGVTVTSLLLLTSVAAAPPLRFEELMFERAQNAFPKVFPGHPSTIANDTYVYRKYANGNMLAVANYNVYMSGPSTGNELKLIGPMEQFRCGLVPRLGGCPPQFEQLIPRARIKADAEQTFVFLSAEAFAEQVSKLIDLPSGPQLMIDWANQMVIGVVLGKKAPPCSSVFIAGTREEANEIVITYRVAGPLPSAKCTDPLAYSTDFVTMKRSPKVISFDRVASP